MAAAALLLLSGAATAQPAPTAPIFRMQADGFWLNLHHFLHVLGRAEAGLPGSDRPAVVAAPADEARGVLRMNDDEQRVWREAVAAYAAGASRRDLVFDAPMPDIARLLADAGDADVAPTLPMDTALEAVLAAVAPLYRRVWWPEHRAANERWVTAMDTLLDRHGRAMVDYIERAYELPWPDGGFPMYVSAYTNWAGAYSTRANVLVIASLDPGARGLHGLETLFHEAMHQWDDVIMGAIRAHAAAAGRTPPPNLSHAMIFYTAGEAVRQVQPSHEPYAHAFGIWQRGWAPLLAALDAEWAPYLGGAGSRDAAIGRLVERVGAR